MAFIGEFTEEDSCQLVANGLGLNPYSCGWMENGLPCDAPLTGNQVPAHLRGFHQINERQRVECLWEGCGEVLNSGCIVRHVEEKHLGYRWPCPKCLYTFSRRGVMDKHRAKCRG